MITNSSHGGAGRGSDQLVPPLVCRRSLTGARWTLKAADEGLVRDLSKTAGVSAIMARALVCRGVSDTEGARAFLADAATPIMQHDPLLMSDMDRAVQLVERTLERGARIRIHGDYDVDGVCATALLVRALGGLDAEVDWYIPHRIDEGYGLNEDAVRQAHAEGVELLITVDCGSTASGPIAIARELGMEVLVTDHHQLRAQADGHQPLPDCPVLNPCRCGCPYPFKELAGVGVAFKLVMALARGRGLADEQAMGFADLVCLGTVADVVPLLGENRVFVQHGLQRLARTRKVGIQELMKAAGVGQRGEVTSRDVAFGLAPRINAAGRMEDARVAVRLLLTKDREEAAGLAATLCAHNDARRAEEQRTLEEAEEMVAAEVELARQKVIVLASERWHPGVIGIVASRLVERHHRPALLVALADGIGKGSGRSIPAFNLWEGMRECEDLFTRFGGHRFAAGFGIEVARLAELRRRINEVADAKLTAEDLTRQIEVDAEIDLCDLTVEAAKELERLAPFGMGNPSPTLVARRVKVQEKARVGNGSHLSLRLIADDGRTAGAIWFGAEEQGEQVDVGAIVDVCFRPKVDEWGGTERVRLHLVDVAAGQGEAEPALSR